MSRGDFFSDLHGQIMDQSVSERFLCTQEVRIPAEEVTEICGPPGAGKTIFLHWLATRNEGVAGDMVVFFDVDRSFRPKLVRSLAEESKSSLSSIYRYAPLDVADFISKVRRVKEQFENARLLLVDSITNLFTQIQDLKKRRKEILKVGKCVRQQAEEGFSIVLSNQIRSTITRRALKEKEKKFGFWRGDIWEEHGFVPALGTLWEYFLDNRILLKRRGKRKVFITVFSSTMGKL